MPLNSFYELLLRKHGTTLRKHQLEYVLFLCIALPLHLKLLLHDSLALFTAEAVAGLRVVIGQVRHSVDDCEEDMVEELLELTPPQPVRATVRRGFVSMVQEAGFSLNAHAAGGQKQAGLELAQANDLASADLSLLKAEKILLDSLFIDVDFGMRLVRCPSKRLNGSPRSDYSAFRLVLQILSKR